MKPEINIPETGDFKRIVSEQIDQGISYSNAGFIAKKLGAHVHGNSVHFLLWHPAVKESRVVFIEFYLPLSELIYDKPDQHSNILYFNFPVETAGEFALAVVDHLPVGDVNGFGAFYQFSVINSSGEKEIIRDPMAWSIPYGIFAPAEVYDVKKVLQNRTDSEYYQKLKTEFSKQSENRIKASVNLLEIHTGTATFDGTIAELTQRYKQIAAALKNQSQLTPDQKNLAGFDGIELMPINPVTEHPVHHRFWYAIQRPVENGSEITIHLRKPNVINWGYDVPVFGSAAINPSLLATGRPHELLELIETLHNHPAGSIKIILDIVYGHADKQASELLPEQFFSGPNRYGLGIDYKHPLVRAFLLEMIRRKLNWGFDGLRVDASHDFTFYDEEHDSIHFDDDFLKQLSDTEAEVSGLAYKPWMIFEDSRPWPRDDWNLAASYRDITEQQKHPHQWAPTIFAYNKPYEYTFWLSKWWRIKEQFHFGEKWITGYANHDTMRRGTQSNPENVNVNFLLGNSLRMVMENAYNNPSTTLIMNTFLPGVPMDFLQALGNTPWSFVRNTDSFYAIKVAAREAFFAEWQITEIEYRNSRFFKKLKNLGFHQLSGLRRFAKTLMHLVDVTDYQPETIALLLNQFDPAFTVQNWTVNKLNQFAQSWMSDLHEYCNTDMHVDYLDSRKTSFNLKTREYRLQNPWLNRNFAEGDFLNYREPVNGAVIYFGYRKNPESGKEIFCRPNM